MYNNQAMLINEETKTHVRLLDAFDDDVEMATAALQVDTKQIYNRNVVLKICCNVIGRNKTCRKNSRSNESMLFLYLHSS